MIRASLYLLACFATGYAVGWWCDPSRLLALTVLTGVCGLVMFFSWGVPNLERAQHRLWLAHRRRVTADDVPHCDFLCAAERCAVMHAWCAKAGQQQQSTNISLHGRD